MRGDFVQATDDDEREPIDFATASARLSAWAERAPSLPTYSSEGWRAATLRRASRYREGRN